MSTVDALRVGARCVAVARATFWWPEAVPKAGPIQITWDGGDVTTIDTRSDWTLVLSNEKWRDPFAGCDVDAPEWDLGRWTLETVGHSDLGLIVGDLLVDVLPRFNEVGEFNGLDLEFREHVLRTESWEGDVRVEVEASPTRGPG